MNYALLSKSLEAQMSQRKRHADHDKNENRISKRDNDGIFIVAKGTRRIKDLTVCAVDLA